MKNEKLTIDDVLGYTQRDPLEAALVGAYGRSYETAEDALKDWNAGKDFKLLNGPYCSIRDKFHLRKMANFVRFLNRDGEILTTLSLA